ncbi:hypothetical protein ACN47E_004173 [Coniothyrium glycines]
MAFPATTAARIVNAMTNDIVPHNTNPLPNKVIHADIRIQGIDDEPETTTSQSLVAVVQEERNDENDAFRKAAERMRVHWEQAIGKDMRQPDGYSHVAVLLIKWADELDQLKTAKETEELSTLFSERFHYQTKTVELNVRQKPQHQLNVHVGEFIREHDSPQTLLIVYYTGHGTYHDQKKVLELTATTDPAAGKGFCKDARASWNKVEDQLRDEDVEADILTILDTCYSSNLVKSGKEEPKKFELLSACAIDQTTASPGEYSFTRALIDATVKLLEEFPDIPISTSSLIQRINQDPRRTDTPSFLWSRGQTVSHNESHVLLAPLKQSTSLPLRPKAFLTLRLGLKDESLNQTQIAFMSRTLTKCFNAKAPVGLRRIEWVDLEPAPPISQWERVTLIMKVMTKWKGVISRRKEKETLSSQELPHVDSMEVDSVTSFSKRLHVDEDETPHAKRRNLEVEHPPSPPVSNSSRMDDEV